MKTLILTTVLVLTLSFASTARTIVAKGESNSAFGNYTIELLDDHMMLNNNELDKYLISYENTDMKVVVVMDKQKKCRKYYVLNDQLPVQYECNGTSFGIKKLDRAVVANGFGNASEKMNKQEFFNQRVLISGVTNTIDHLNLIASYYPGLFS
jgi:hypothetical protein